MRMTATIKNIRPTVAMVDPTVADIWINEHGDHLFGVASTRLHDPIEAEEVVQETFLAAFRSGSPLERMSIRSWLTAILKQKLEQRYRRLFHPAKIANLAPLDESDAFHFDSHGRWARAVEAVDTLERTELVTRLRSALSNLPKRLAVAYTLRELDGLEIEEICKILNISQGKLLLLLHRARLRLFELLTKGSN